MRVVIERDRARSQIKDLQHELDDAGNTLRYMEKLLRALKAHKKTAEAAQAALAGAKAEIETLQGKLANAKEDNTALQQTIHERDGHALALQEQVARVDGLEARIAQLTVKLLLAAAISGAKTSESRRQQSEIAATQKLCQRLERKLDATEQRLSTAQTQLSDQVQELASAHDAAQQVQRQLDATSKSLDLEQQRTAQLSQRLERETAAVVATHNELERARIANEQTLATIRTEGNQLQDRCAFHPGLQTVRGRRAVLSVEVLCSRRTCL